MKKIKYIIILLLTSLIFIPNVSASVNTKNREEIENYGVNKKWDITNTNRPNVMRTPLVDSSEKVYDFSDKLSEEDKTKIKEKLTEFTNKTKMDVAFVLVNLPYTYDKENEDYAADFYDYNDFGIDFKNYDGVLLLRNTYENNPYYNIYTFGDAQLYFSYNRCENMLDNIYNDFHSENYVNGINTFVNDFINYYKSGIPTEMKNYTIDEKGFLKKVYKTPYKLIILIDSIITTIIILVLVGKNKMVKKNLNTKDYINSKDLIFRNTNDTLINSYTTHYTTSSSSSSGGGFSSSGGSSGGGHSSGGGRHG